MHLLNKQGHKDQIHLFIYLECAIGSGKNVEKGWSVGGEGF